jgi:hypothetical protein
MRNALMMGFGVVMFVVGAFAAPLLRAQGDRERPKEVATRALLPEWPSRGKVVKTPGFEDCKVIAVISEWVKCEDRPIWRNLYNGASYSVLDSLSREQ